MMQGFSYTRVDNRIVVSARLVREELTRLAEGIFMGLDDAQQVELLRDCARFIEGEAQPSEIAEFIGSEIKKSWR